jgi:hypothetical protein
MQRYNQEATATPDITTSISTPAPAPGEKILIA